MFIRIDVCMYIYAYIYMFVYKWVTARPMPCPPPPSPRFHSTPCHSLHVRQAAGSMCDYRCNGCAERVV